ncbi:MAG: hypothetical protein Q9211_005069 [Gyalolechia sp. 1 TL-2023]
MTTDADFERVESIVLRIEDAVSDLHDGAQGQASDQRRLLQQNLANQSFGRVQTDLEKVSEELRVMKSELEARLVEEWKQANTTLDKEKTEPKDRWEALEKDKLKIAMDTGKINHERETLAVEKEEIAKGRMALIQAQEELQKQKIALAFEQGRHHEKEERLLHKTRKLKNKLEKNKLETRSNDVDIKVSNNDQSEGLRQ